MPVIFMKLTDANKDNQFNLYLKPTISETIIIGGTEEIKRILRRHVNVTIVDVAEKRVKTLSGRNHFPNLNLE
jgi:hypothetical protein